MASQSKSSCLTRKTITISEAACRFKYWKPKVLPFRPPSTSLSLSLSLSLSPRLHSSSGHRLETPSNSGDKESNIYGKQFAVPFLSPTHLTHLSLSSRPSLSLVRSNIHYSTPAVAAITPPRSKTFRERERVAEERERGGRRAIGDLQNMGSETTVLLKKSKKASKKRAASDPDHSTSGDIVDIGNGEVADGVLVDDDLNEPTMGEKLATLNLVDGDIENRNKNDELPLAAKPPSVDSVHVLLRQALHADDRTLLLNCLYTQDEKVIAKSISLLNPSDVSKLLQSLISSIQSRGAILACALPWLRCLLLQHASGIMSQEFSIVSLNSLYQLIESRVSTFHSALQLSSVLGVLYADIVDDELDESNVIVPVIIEDKDESDEEESEDTMETDGTSEEDSKAPDEAFGGLSDLEGNDMSE